MSQNKTVFPGMDNSHGRESAGNSIYSRDSFSPQSGSGKSTRIIGVEQDEKPAKKSVDNGKPIRGFLYSISKSVVGEFWPLRQGKNTIGSSPKCDICLKEATVSEEHASITIRILEKQEKTIASLKDTDSTNGTKINGEDVDFDANKCVNGDIIRFGSCYECLLILIDTKETGLSVAENFIPLESDDEEAESFENDVNSETIFYREQQESNAGGTVGIDSGPRFRPNKHLTEGM